MELNEEEKRQLFQVDGDCQAKVLDELYIIDEKLNTRSYFTRGI